MEQNQNSSTIAEVKYANVSSDERTLAILCHVLSIFFWFIPALIIYILKKDDSPYVAEHTKEALNFQITFVIYYIISVVLMLVLVGIFIFFAVWAASIIFCIIAAIKANDDILYRYPLTIRLIK